MKIYELQVVSRQGTVYEKAHFTSKKTALDSMLVVREHYINKFDLDVSNIKHEGTSKDEMLRVDLDDRFILSVITWDMKTQVIKYVD